MNTKVSAATLRAKHVVLLVSNVGINLEVLVPLDNPGGGEMLWQVDVLVPWPFIGKDKPNDWYTVHVYAHERSAMRAVYW